MFIGIEHIAIASPDTRRLAEWYVQTLDFKLVHEDSGAYFVKAQNGVVIEIIAAIGERPATGMKTPGLRHLAIAVDDFDAAYANLQRHDVQFLGEPYEGQGNRLVFFCDADGNILHLIRRGGPLGG